MIPFNKPAVTGNEFLYMREACEKGKLSGNGYFTQKCHTFFKERYHFKKVLLTNSCTDALEMAAILCNINNGDEVIIPSFTFPSCANAFILRGARILFADSEPSSPNIDIQEIEKKISAKTKAIVIVHYAGEPCKMEEIAALAQKNNLFLIEDCAHAIDSFHDNKPLGSYGDFAAFSFHETKNVHCGEGGLLVVNNTAYAERADIIWEKGTNRVAFAEKKISKYNWVDTGSSFLPSELQAAFLYAQFENMELIQTQRKALWQAYKSNLQNAAQNYRYGMPVKMNNASIFYLTCPDENKRNDLLTFLEKKGIMAVFHYLPLHLSPYYLTKNSPMTLPNAEKFSSLIIRLPLFIDLEPENVSKISADILTFFQDQ